MESVGGGLFFAGLGAFLLWMEKDQSVALATRLKIPRPDSQVVVYAGLSFLACGIWFALGNPAPPVFGALFAAVALVFICREIWLLRDVKSWPTADAVVTYSAVEQGSGSTTINENRELAHATYAPVIRFSYETPCGTMESWNGSFDGAPAYTDEERAASVVRQHPVGSEIAVRYCPGQPTKTFIGGNPLPKAKIWLALGFCGALVLLAYTVFAG